MTRSRTTEVARDRGGLRARWWLVASAEQVLDLGLAVATMATQRPDGGQLARLCPAGDRLRVHPEHGGDLGRRQQLVGVVALRLGYHRHVFTSSIGVILHYPAQNVLSSGKD